MAGSNAFGLKCTNKGGDLYTNITAFLGCCAINPVLTDDSLCPIDEVRPMTFDPAAYAAIPPQACVGKDPAVMWYSCTGTSPPFIGCCAVNPCKEGTCPDAALRPGRLSDIDENASAFLRGIAATPTSSGSSSSSSNIGGRGTVISYVTSTTTVIVEDGPTSTSSSSAASKGSSSTTTATTTTTAVAMPTTTSAAQSSSSTNAGERQGMQPTAIAGMAAGIGAGLLLLGVFIFWLVRRRRAAAAAKKEQDTYLAAGLSPPLPHRQQHQGLAPPGYYAAKPASPPPAELPGNVYYELPGDGPRR